MKYKMKTVITVLATLLLAFPHSAESAENYQDQDIADFNSCIPNEIKAMIFEYASRDTNPGDLRLVCRDWRDIIDDGRTTEAGKGITYKDIGDVWRKCIHAWYGATGREAILEQFLNGKLVYKPNKDNDQGMIELRISDLPNPFAGRFGLSKCGATGKHLAIMTGFREKKLEENKDKVEIWISPRFLIEKFRESTANHFEPIMEKWDEKTAPLGLFYTWGNWDSLGWYEYITNKSPKEISNKNLHALLHHPITHHFQVFFHFIYVEFR